MITKKEIKFILYSSIFAFIIFGLILPYVYNSGLLENINPILQFFLFNVMLFVFFQIFLSAIITGTKLKIIKSLGLLSLFTALDLWATPLILSPKGILNQNVILGSSASDYAIAVLFQSIGVSGFFLYFLTYVVSPVILLFISALILKDISKNLPD